MDERFEHYSRLFDELRLTHPQRCGLDRGEFRQAIAHPGTVSVPVAAGARSTEVPQLVPIDVFEWLNAAHYRHLFTRQYDDGSLAHLTLLPAMDLGDASKDRLREMADRDGVVVFDGPAEGDASPSVIAARLRTAMEGDIRVGEPELLGTQTYWLGQLRSETVEPSDDPLSFREAWARIRAGGGPPAEIREAELCTELTEDEVATMFDIYDEAYKVLNRHPCAQGVTPEEFREMTLERDRVDKLVVRRDGTVESICLVTPDLASLTWINYEYYRARFGDRIDRGGVHWYPGIATDPDKAGAHNAAAIVGLLACLYEESRNPAALLFDTPDLNADFLPAYLTDLINATPQFRVRFEVIGSHEYHAVRLAR